MSIEHIQVLQDELPELFKPRDLPPYWDDNFIFEPIVDPERNDEIPERTTDAYAGNLPDDNFDALERFGTDLIEPGGPFPESSQPLSDILGGTYAGAPLPFGGRSRMPPTDCLAFYLPFHYYHPTWWGVYLLFDGVVWLAGEIVKRSGWTVGRLQAIRAARMFLYYHEAFHHRTECFATRLEVTHRKPFYTEGFERLYRSKFMTIDCREEGLANATAFRKCDSKFKSAAIYHALEGFIQDSPPGYDQGVRICAAFEHVRCIFAEENQQICLPHLPAKKPEVWRAAPHLFDGIMNIKGRVNYVISRGSPLAARLPFRPMLPARKLVKKLKEMVGLEFVRHGGNHDFYRTRSGRPVPIPRHPGDLDRELLRRILREAGCDMGLEEFLQQ